MSLSPDTRKRAQEFLQPDEEIRDAFAVTSVQREPSVRAAHAIIVVTDVSITVLATAPLNRGKPKAVLARFPRHTPIRAVQMVPGPIYRLDDLTFQVNPEDGHIINATEAERPAPPPGPSDQHAAR